MKKQEIKKLSKDEAIKNIDKFKKDLFNFRFQKINSQITNPAKINQTKKSIARLKTFLKGIDEFRTSPPGPFRHFRYDVRISLVQFSASELHKASSYDHLKVKH